MKNKLIKFFTIILLSVFLLLGVFYFLVVNSYKDGFTYGTWINSVYCTGKTVDEVNEELINNYEIGIIEITSERFDTETINLSDINFTIDYKDSLENLYNSQNPYLWFRNISKTYINGYMNPQISVDENLLKYEIDKLKFISYFSDNNIQEVKIIYGENGYCLYDTRQETINYDTAYSLIKSEILNGHYTVSVDSIFDAPSTNESIVKTLDLWDELERFLSTKIIYDMGSEIIPVDARVLSAFLVRENNDFKRNDDGSFYINEEYVRQFVDNICTMYDTYGKERTYVTYHGEEKIIRKSIYGTRLNKIIEQDYLVEAIKNNLVENHIPTYEKVGYSRGLNDIGSEYIEVDLTNQKLYYIKNNELIIDTDIVSGKPSAGYATPELLCYVYKKAEHAVLRGEGYASPVDYWMAINGAIGLHDASWQSKFGGTRYLTHGSRGCINMKDEDASLLYSMIEVGVPVIVYK